MDNTAKTPDDLEAVRVIAAALAPFTKNDQERIIRWAREKVGLETDGAEAKLLELVAAPAAGTATARMDSAPAQRGGDIKQFVEQKRPKSDMHFAAVVAYYHRFNAPTGDRKNSVTAEDLQDACRKADRERLRNPGQTLINAFHSGLLDREGRGEFSINSVGENLVAMALPEPAEGNSRLKTRNPKIKSKSAKQKKR